MMFITAIMLVTIVPDLVIWHRYGDSWPMAWKLPYGLTTIWGAMLVWVMQAWPFGHVRSIRLFFTSMLLLCVPKLFFMVLDPLVGWPAALAVALSLVAAFAYGFVFGWRRLSIVEEVFCFDNLPEEFDGYRILHLSDLHLGSMAGHEKFLESLVDAANVQNADLIVFTGDLVNHLASEAKPFIPALRRLKSPDGVYSVLGNHDLIDMDHTSDLVAMEREAGWMPLRNSHIMLRRGGAEIAIAGVDNKGAPPFEGFGDLETALRGIPPSTFTVLLTHDPTHWRLEVTGCRQVRLSLSGHTHGGQLRIGKLSVARMLYREWAGTYRTGSSILHVSQGISGSVPFRLGAWPEMSVITLRRGHPSQEAPSE